MVDTTLPHTIITVNHTVHGPWCNRKVGPGKYLIPGDARRFFRNVADTKLLAYGHVVLELVDPKLALPPAPVVEEVVPIVVPVVEVPVKEVEPEVVVEPEPAPVIEESPAVTEESEDDASSDQKSSDQSDGYRTCG